MAAEENGSVADGMRYKKEDQKKTRNGHKKFFADRGREKSQ
jgi:hypothetical protein